MASQYTIWKEINAWEQLEFSETEFSTALKKIDTAVFPMSVDNPSYALAMLMFACRQYGCLNLEKVIENGITALELLESLRHLIVDSTEMSDVAEKVFPVADRKLPSPLSDKVS